jgi:hypothetical protein
MKITTKFSLDDTVYAMVNNAIVALEIYEVIPGPVNKAWAYENKYKFRDYNGSLELTESKLFTTKQELVNSLL